MPPRRGVCGATGRSCACASAFTNRAKPFRLERGQVGKIERASVTYPDSYIVIFGRRRVLLDHDYLEAYR